MHTNFHWGNQAVKSNSEDFETVLKILTQFIDNKEGKILDYGCGNGTIANMLMQHGYNVYGVDASLEGITSANKTFASTHQGETVRKLTA